MVHPHILKWAASLLAVAWVSGCTPVVGDSCVLSTDCSSAGDRVCDTSEPDGYCTVENCLPNTCPDEAACVLFNPSVPGCGYSDRTKSRVGHSFCVAHCNSNSDCRDGYVCTDPRLTPWQAIILDDDQIKHNCLPIPDDGVVIGGEAGAGDPDAAVCQVVSPEIQSELAEAGAAAAAALDAAAAGDATIRDAGTD